MARSTERTERAHDSQLSVWPAEFTDPPAPPPAWLQPLVAWQRWADRRRQARGATAAGRAADAPSQPNLAHRDMPTLPETGRGQALRQAHRALRDRLRAQRGLRRVLPHLYFVERALAHQGSVALNEVPVWVLQRALQQLSRLPADSLAEREQLSVLQQRLVEAIGERSLRAAHPWHAPEPSLEPPPDSFMGGLDSQFGPRSGFQTGPGALDTRHMRDAPPASFDDVLPGDVPWRDEAANRADSRFDQTAWGQRRRRGDID